MTETVTLRILNEDESTWLVSLDLTASNVIQVTVGSDPFSDRPALKIKLNAEAGAWLSENTRKYLMHQMQMAIDSRVILDAQILEPMESGEFMISGGRSRMYEELKRAIKAKSDFEEERA
ncbi:hypothetical protein GCM10022600_13060 [Qipengyuania pelagi]|jgi:preprotein translocase subunit SecD|uniref:SecDF P1 head subdomain domain-containing protein n=1 Tax=Qipengyuania pelagi TaxID=994320 RepID=A0A844Y8Q3_9SPHN|nr:hypothetical protein [Qipengyuania pelagi]MXO53829.1 hypothetical protein [Qipengyuania pelagi]|tara:strand:+ start:289 stop:648 length:360 start_codon:yes stop_codon:yes gene_type:complete